MASRISLEYFYIKRRVCVNNHEKDQIKKANIGLIIEIN